MNVGEQTMRFYLKNEPAHHHLTAWIRRQVYKLLLRLSTKECVSVFRKKMKFEWTRENEKKSEQTSVVSVSWAVCSQVTHCLCKQPVEIIRLEYGKKLFSLWCTASTHAQPLLSPQRKRIIYIYGRICQNTFIRCENIYKTASQTQLFNKLRSLLLCCRLIMPPFQIIEDATLPTFVFGFENAGNLHPK